MSRYRGEGKITIDDRYVMVKGRRIHTPLMLAALGIISFLLSLYLVNEFTDKVLHFRFSEQSIMMKAGVYILLLMFSFYLVEYVFLTREDFNVEFEAVNKFAYFHRGGFAAASISELPRCSPLMFRSEKMDELIQALRNKIPGKELKSKRI